MVSKFSSRFLFLSGRCLPFFKHTQKIDDICWVYGKPRTGQVKFKISPGTGEAKFSLGEAGKNSMCRVSLGLLQKSVFMPGIFVDGSFTLVLLT